MEKVDRRGFFAGIGAFFTAVFTPVSPPNLATRLLTTKLKPMKLMQTATFSELPAPTMIRGRIGPFPYDNNCDMKILESLTDFVIDDPFQTFVVDTNEVV